jgi:dTDP-glucose 4,6-dehydratase
MMKFRQKFWGLIFLFFAVLTNVHAAENKANVVENKTILVTGGAGFIGSNFVTYMFDKYPSYDIIVLDALTYAGTVQRIPEKIRNSPRFKFFHGTILDQKLVDSLMSVSDFVVHFAAETHVARSIVDDYAFFETDVLGTRVLMDSLVRHNKKVERFVHISTSEVYGTAEYEPMDEKHPLNPRSPYAAAKAGADRLVYSYFCTHNVPVVIFRPFNNFGSAQHLEKMLPCFISRAIENEPLTIQGNGEQLRDWVYTLDVAEAVDRAFHVSDFEPLKGEVINIGTGKAISVLEIAKDVLNEFSLDESHLLYVADRPGQVMCHISSTDKAKKLLGWSAKTEFKDGLKETVSWYKQNRNMWKQMEEDMLVHVEIENSKTGM